MKRTGIEAGVPASGNETCCVLTSVPSSSTSSVTFCPSNPDCDNTTSTISVVPLSAVFGVDDAADLNVFRQRLAADADR